MVRLMSLFYFLHDVRTIFITMPFVVRQKSVLQLRSPQEDLLHTNDLTGVRSCTGDRIWEAAGFNPYHFIQREEADRYVPSWAQAAVNKQRKVY